MNDYKFVPTDPEQLTSEMISSYEHITGHTVRPADPERLFIAWIASVITQERVYQNYSANQNIPSRASGGNLDALGKWIYALERKPPQKAKCTVRFNLTQAQSGALLIAAGTRVTDRNRELYWATTADAVIPAGDIYTEIMVQCETPGEVGNGWTAGSIDTLVDVDNVLYFDSCENTTESDGGADAESDADYFNLMRQSLSAYSTAGPAAAYVFWAKSVSDNIADVKVVLPKTTETITAEVFDVQGGKAAFIGAAYLEGSISVSANGAPTAYTAEEIPGGLIKITLTDTTLTEVEITCERVKAGQVDIYALMSDGTAAGATVKTLIQAACDENEVRPLTDKVNVRDPIIAEYNIDVVYYISDSAQGSAAEIQAAVDDAVDEYVKWQSAAMGRDVNPSKLHALLMSAGIKRAVITAPVFTHLSDGSDGTPPEIAQIGTKAIQNGGFEDE